jgi:hypothetical protein
MLSIEKRISGCLRNLALPANVRAGIELAIHVKHCILRRIGPEILPNSKGREARVTLEANSIQEQGPDATFGKYFGPLHRRRLETDKKGLAIPSAAIPMRAPRVTTLRENAALRL